MLLQFTLKYYLIVLFIWSTNITWAQIQINNAIQAPYNDSISIKNIGIFTDSTQLVTTTSARINYGQYFTSTNSGDTLIIYSESDLYSVKNGLILYVKSPINNTGNSHLKMNSVKYPILKNKLSQLDKEDILTDKILVLYYKDSTFQLLNPENPPCPTGYVKVNKSYCIQTTETTGTFWNAITTCNNAGTRLCSWSEWYYACQNTTLGLTGRTNNWEWINSGQNEPSQAKIVGNGVCEITTHGTLTNNYGIRCCFSY